MDDPTDRGQAQTRSALTLNSSEPLPDWWTLLAAEMDRLMRLLPPEGHTAEMIGARSKAAGKFFAERYRNRPEVVGILRDVVTQVVGDSDKFPPPAELVRRMESRMFVANPDRDFRERMRLTKERLDRETREIHARLDAQIKTDMEFRRRVDLAKKQAQPTP